MAKRRRKKKKLEFSKLLVLWSLILTTACIIISYILAFQDHDSCSDITTSVATTCIAIAVGYEAKSFGEKNSRNRYGIKIEPEECRDDGDDGEALG